MRFQSVTLRIDASKIKRKWEFVEYLSFNLTLGLRFCETLTLIWVIPYLSAALWWCSAGEFPTDYSVLTSDWDNGVLFTIDLYLNAVIFTGKFRTEQMCFEVLSKLVSFWLHWAATKRLSMVRHCELPFIHPEQLDLVRYIWFHCPYHLVLTVLDYNNCTHCFRLGEFTSQHKLYVVHRISSNVAEFYHVGQHMSTEENWSRRLDVHFPNNTITVPLLFTSDACFVFG